MPKLLIIVSLLAGQSAEWRDVAGALAAKHLGEATVVVECAEPTESLEILRRERPRYAAFVMQPRELDEGVEVRLREIMRSVDDDPFDDAIWGVVTGPSAADALRIASSREPSVVHSMLATTGVDADVVDGEVAVLSDAYPEGEWWRKDGAGDISRHSTTGEMVSAFVEAWNTIDPEMLLTSSHATEHNLEMPFSRGMIVSAPVGALRYAVCNTVRAPGADGRVVCEMSETPAVKPARREKVWLAAGNCLIANHLDDHDMVMTALSFGKVNQFVGYIKKTWFGFVGWNTWRFMRDGHSLAESYYAANQWLALKLALGEAKDEMELKGLLWDRDATLFYGDPMHRVCLPPSAKAADDACRIVVFASATQNPPEIPAPEGSTVYVADDFAIILPKPVSQ